MPPLPTVGSVGIMFSGRPSGCPSVIGPSRDAISYYLLEQVEISETLRDYNSTTIVCILVMFVAVVDVFSFDMDLGYQ